jgi:hypothetical protein
MHSRRSSDANSQVRAAATKSCISDAGFAYFTEGDS